MEENKVKSGKEILDDFFKMVVLICKISQPPPGLSLIGVPNKLVISKRLISPLRHQPGSSR